MTRIILLATVNIALCTLCSEELKLHQFEDDDAIKFKETCFQYFLILTKEMAKRFP